MHFDIAIIGYGPVGAVAANMFGSSGHDVVVIEPKKDIWDIPRAVALDGQTQRIFQSIGVIDDIARTSFEGLKFINKKGKEIVYVDFSKNLQPNGYYETVGFSQPNLERDLRSRALKYENINFKLGKSLKGLSSEINKNNLTLIDEDTDEVEEISSTYVLACDGANSFVRQKLNIKSFNYECDQDWIVVDYEIDPKYEILAGPMHICDYKRPTTLAHISGQHIRWEFKFNENDDVDQIEKHNSIRSMMNEHAWRLNPDIDINTGNILRASKYTFHGLVADTFKLNNCFLVGDSAHQMPPFLGQGLCQGVKDVYNLHWKLDGVINGEYADKVLETYSSERISIVKHVTETAIKHGGVIGTQNKYIALIRDTLLNAARIFPKLLSFFDFYHPWQIDNGLIDKTLYPNKANGIVISQPNLDLKVNNKSFDQYIGYCFALIVFNQNEILFNNIKALESSKIFKNKIYLINKDSPFNKDENFIKWRKDNNISAVIIRPDRHVYGCCDDESMITKIDKLNKKLISEIT
jgi:3-(3-hydroxy-phenyl)propionate hydroxylase